MLIVTGSRITEQEATNYELSCSGVDYASILLAEQHSNIDMLGCSQLPVFSISLRLAEDMIIPSFLCSIHFTALKMSLEDGSVGVDEDIFGEIPKEN